MKLNPETQLQHTLAALFPTDYGIQFRRRENPDHEDNRNADLIEITFDDGSQTVAMTRHEFQAIASMVEMTDEIPIVALPQTEV